jgi:hypothetical protein
LFQVTRFQLAIHDLTKPAGDGGVAGLQQFHPSNALGNDDLDSADDEGKSEGDLESMFTLQGFGTKSMPQGTVALIGVFVLA